RGATAPSGAPSPPTSDRPRQRAPVSPLPAPAPRSSVFFAHAHQYSSLTLISILRSRSCPRGPRPLERIALGHQRLAAHEGVVLAQRVALELRVHEDAPQVGVPGETDAEHVPRLALGPERGLPERRDGGDERILFRDRRLHAEAVVPAERVEL